MGRIGCALVAVVAVGLFAGVSQAQPPGPVAASRPVYSPYLNLVRRDASPGFNYYGLVRPQFATQNSLQSLQQQIVTGQQQQQLAGQSVINSDLPITGQQTFFLNTGGYFLNTQTGGGGPTNPSVTTRSMPPSGGRMR